MEDKVVEYYINWPPTFRRILCVLLLVHVPFSAANRCDAIPFGSVFVGSSLPTSIFDKVYPGGLALCARECKYRQRCKSFNYVDATDECQLNEDVLTGAGQSANGVSYSNIDTWPESIAGLCANVICTDSDKCVLSAGSSTCETIYYNVTTANNTALIGHVFDTVIATTDENCAAACYARKACASFNYRNAVDRCELNSDIMITDYVSYIGNQQGTIYRTIDQYNPSVAGVCSSQPCDQYSECEDRGGGAVCIIKYCSPPASPPSDVHVVPEFDQSVKLFSNGTTLGYSCLTSYFPVVDWLCHNGTWLDPECQAIKSCTELFTKCNTGYTDGNYIFKYPETEHDVVIICDKSLPSKMFLRIYTNSTFSYYSTRYDEMCHLEESTCGRRVFTTFPIYFLRTGVLYMDDSGPTSTDCDGPRLHQAGKTCVENCTEASDGEFQIDVRGSGLKHQHSAILGGSTNYSDNDQVVRGICNECESTCRPSSSTFLILSTNTEVNYSETVKPACTTKT